MDDYTNKRINELIEKLKRKDEIIEGLASKIEKQEKIIDKRDNTVERLKSTLEDTQEELEISEQTTKNLQSKMDHFYVLKKVGNVYNTKRNTEKRVFREMLCSQIDEKYYHLLDFSAKKVKGGKLKTDKQYAIHATFLKLAANLTKEYTKVTGKVPARYKGKIVIPDMVGGKSGLHNEYEPIYKYVIIDYLKKHPITTWHKIKHGIKPLPEGFSTVEDPKRCKCNVCIKTMLRTSAKKHVESDTHKQNII